MSDTYSFNVTYDRRTDTLYISTLRAPAARATEDQYGIVWRYGRDGDLIGATIMDFVDVWGDKGEALAAQLALRFDIPETQALNVVEHALDGSGPQ